MRRYEAHLKPTWPRGDMVSEAVSDDRQAMIAFIERRLDELFPGQWTRLNDDQWGTPRSNLIMAHLWVNYSEEEVERQELLDLEHSIPASQRRLAALRAKYE